MPPDEPGPPRPRRRLRAASWCLIGLATIVGVLGSTLVGRAVVPAARLDDPPFSSARAVAVGGGHACAVTMARRVLCWGSSFWGQRGNGFSQSLADGHTVAGLGPVRALSSGNDFTCAVDEEHQVTCWGLNVRDDDREDHVRPAPGPVAVVPGDVVVARGIRDLLNQ